jgi:hypothetical protein
MVLELSNAPCGIVIAVVVLAIAAGHFAVAKLNFNNLLNLVLLWTRTVGV